MPVRPRHTLLGLLLLCASVANAAQPQAPQVTWNMSPWPGLINVRDERPGDGIIVELLQQIVQRLPEYRHDFRLNNLTRGLEQLKREPLGCFLPTFPTPE